MKTFDRKDVFSWNNAEEAKTYIGKTGYFNNDFESIKRVIELGDPVVLDRVDTNSIWCFKALGVSLCFGLFLPAEKVKEVEEKKWRPFGNMDEFTKCILNSLNVSPIHHIIEIEDTFTAKQCTIQILGKFKNGLILPIYGAQTFEQLFNRFKIFNDCHEIGWQPFGVLE